MDDFSVTLQGRSGIDVVEDGTFKVSSDGGVLMKYILEFSRHVGLFDFIDELDGVWAVASAATVLDSHEGSWGILVAQGLTNGRHICKIN